jgi:hypothetical protein
MRPPGFRQRHASFMTMMSPSSGSNPDPSGFIT